MTQATEQYSGTDYIVQCGVPSKSAGIVWLTLGTFDTLREAEGRIRDLAAEDTRMSGEGAFKTDQQWRVRVSNWHLRDAMGAYYGGVHAELDRQDAARRTVDNADAYWAGVESGQGSRTDF